MTSASLVCKVPLPTAPSPSRPPSAHNYAVPSDTRRSLLASLLRVVSHIPVIDALLFMNSALLVSICFKVVMPRYKYCIVPECKNTTRSTPDKLFFSVPTGEKRKEWCSVIGRIPGKHKTLSPRCNRFICEDHFNLQEDMENYMMWRTVGVGKLMLKKGVLPHKFKCRNQQSGDKKNDTMSGRSKQTDTEICHGAVVTEIKDEYIKEHKSGRIYIYKGKDNENHQNVKYEIKEEVTECVSMSEDAASIIIKDEVDEMETYVFNVHYDSDTGAEYLIDIPKKVK